MSAFQIIQIIFWGLTSIGLWFAWLTYRKDQKIKKGEWLKSLFEKFYEDDRYKEVRKWLDSDELTNKVSPDDSAISKEDESFTDFLNFFEFIAKLEFDGYLTQQDIKDMFDYYLKKLKESEVSLKWIEDYGFEKLKNMLKRLYE